MMTMIITMMIKINIDVNDEKMKINENQYY